ncbi:hypothetical protein BJ741DRAFT_566300 [Chytriomyces cf. hyalinus JEL632]|nr:hypothetical protein BJ741DRAFT_566300 [Chytriomyces cf. hyalinus JEL632]
MSADAYWHLVATTYALSKPLRDARIACSLHFTQETIPFVAALARMGAAVNWAIDDLNQQNEHFNTLLDAGVVLGPQASISSFGPDGIHANFQLPGGSNASSDRQSSLDNDAPLSQHARQFLGHLVRAFQNMNFAAQNSPADDGTDKEPIPFGEGMAEFNATPAKNDVNEFTSTVQLTFGPSFDPAVAASVAWAATVCMYTCSKEAAFSTVNKGHWSRFETSFDNVELTGLMILRNQLTSKNGQSVSESKLGNEQTALILGDQENTASITREFTAVAHFKQTGNQDFLVGVSARSSHIASKYVRWMAVEFASKLQLLAMDDITSTTGRLLKISVKQQEYLRQDLVRGSDVDADFVYAHECLTNHDQNLVAIQPSDGADTRNPGIKYSYALVESLSNRLAHLLRSRGLSPNATNTDAHSVALIVTRSPEFIIAMFGVLKAGLAFIPIEASTPPDRISYILDATRPLAVCTTNQAHFAVPRDYQENVVLLDTLKDCNDIPTHPLPCLIKPDFLAYTIFTSGSTGHPKGVQINHSGIATRALNHPIMNHLGPNIRMLQTFTVGFDACLEEIFHALHAGATLVLWGRDNIAQVMKTVDTIMITPTGLQSLDPTDYPNLKAICVGGEACQTPVVEKWGDKVHLYSDYGPTEATMVCMCTDRLVSGSRITLGRPLANTRIYIVDEELNELPIGVMGRLFIGGVGIARGYLNRPDLNSTKFLQDLMKPDERMYDSGDLGRWLDCDQVAYLGRSDDQVKLKGYRVELDEISAAMAKHPEITTAAAIVRNGKTLMGFYTPKKVDPDKLASFLSAALPSYMIPSVLYGLDTMPVNVNGKTDKKALQQIEIQEKPTEKTTTTTESKIAQVWAEVLGVPLESVGRSMTFFELGGDSISAIRVAAKCKALGLGVTTALLFKYPTLSQLAVAAPVVAEPVSTTMQNEPVTGPVPLTPVAWEFFKHEWKDMNQYNQGFVLKPSKFISIDALQAAIKQLVIHHDMLRIRFIKNVETREWSQHILPVAEDGSLNVSEVQLHSLRDLDARIKSDNESLSITHGPIYIARLYTIPDQDQVSQRLLFTAHHTIVDLVSWRILLDDLESLIGGRTLEPKTVSFKAWAEGMVQQAEKYDPELWREYVRVDSEASFGQPGSSPESPRVFTHQLSLDEATSAQLNAANLCYNTNIQDLALAALTCSFAEMKDANGVSVNSFCINLEGHGREPWSNEMDVSNTVGWFTSGFPVRFEADAQSPDIRNVILQVKNKIRSVPDKGLSYGAIKYLAKPSLANHYIQRGEGSNMWEFNYLGKFQSLVDGKSLFAIENMDEDEFFGCNDSLPHAGAIQCIHKNDRLCITYRGEDWFFSSANIQILFQGWVKWMNAIVLHCLDPLTTGGLTLSDVPLVGSTGRLEQVEIALKTSLGMDPRDVEDVYPLTPLQAGFIAAMIKDPSAYTVQAVYDFKGNFQLSKFCSAWKAVAKNHTILRTTFVSTGDGLFQVVLKKDYSEWTAEANVWSAAEVESKSTRFLEVDRVRGFNLGDHSMQRFHSVTLSDGRTRLFWTQHHSVSDAWSDPIIFNDLMTAYQGQTLEPAIPFREHVEWTMNIPQEESRLFWSRSMKNMQDAGAIKLPKPEPAFTPVIRVAGTSQVVNLPMLSGSAQKYGFTLNTLLRLAWAVTLKQYTRNENVVFGSVVSGREKGINGIDRMVGMLINTIPVPVTLQSGKTVKDALNDLQEFAGESTEHAHCGLIDIKRWANLENSKAMFDSLFVFESYPTLSSDASSGLEFTNVSVKEYVDYPLCTVFRSEGDTYRAIIAYHTDFVEETIVQNMLDKFVNVLEEIQHHLSDASKGALYVDDLESLTAQQLDLISKTCTGKIRDSEFQFVHHGFESCAKRCPDNIALEWGQGKMTYGELNALANGLAASLTKVGVRANHCVAVFMNRSIVFPACLIGVLKAGGTIVTIDSGFPAERVSSILADSGAMAVVTVSQLSETLAQINSLLPCVFADSVTVQDSFSPLAAQLVSPDDIFLIVYTSGSTGKPKGVPVKHCSACNTICDVSHRLGYRRGFRSAQCLAISFTASAIETWCPLSQGATLVIHQEDLIETVSKVQTLFITPTGLSRLGDPAKFPNLQFVQVAGEVCSIELKNLWASAVSFSCVYGCSEIGLMTAQDYQSMDDNFVGSRPIANTSIKILDKNFKQVPVGVTGEIFVTGVGVSNGYMNLPKLTAEKFLPDPTSKTASLMFRTADLGCMHPNGRLQVIGRDDDVVKLKGFRIELGEIVVAAKKHSLVTAAAAVVKDKSFLALFYTPKHVDMEELRELLAISLPTYMVPSVLVGLESMPTNVNGKLDRKALSEMNLDSTKADLETLTEKHMAAIWADVLSVPFDSIGRSTSFFEIGGDSIRAITVLSRARQIGLHFTVSDLFKAQTLSRIAAFAKKNDDVSLFKKPVEEARLSESDLREIQLDIWPNLAIEGNYDAYQVTALQNGMVAATIIDRSAYVEQFPFECTEKVDISRLQTAYQAILLKHDILRTAFVSTSTGMRQILHEDVSDTINVAIGVTLASFLEMDKRRGFTTADKRWIRMTLLTDGPEDCIVITASHAVYDGWCHPFIVQDFFSAYNGESIPVRPPFKSVVNYVQSREPVLSEVFWRSYLDGYEPNGSLSFGTTGSVSNKNGPENKACTIPMDAIQQACKSANVTPAIILKAAWAITLRKYLRGDAVCFGQIVSGRDVPIPGAEMIVGPLMNGVPCYVKFKKDVSIQTVLNELQNDHMKMSEHSHASVTDIQRWLGVKGDGRLFSTMFVFENLSEDPRYSAHRSNFFKAVQIPNYSGESDVYPIEIYSWPQENGILFSAKFKSGVLSRNAVAQLLLDLDHSIRKVVDAVTNRDGKMDDWSLCEEQEKFLREVSVGPTVTMPFELAQDVFRSVCQQNGDEIALDDGTRQVSYSELDAKSNQIAHYLNKLRLTKGSIVALIVTRSIEFVAGMLGIMKSGCAFLPIEASTPGDRIEYMLAESQASMVLATSKSKSAIPASFIGHVFVLDNIPKTLPSQPATATTSASDLAYVIFTSGTTGLPKGVLINHSGIVGRILIHPIAKHLGPGVRMSQTFTVGFDACLQEVFLALFTGSVLVMREKTEFWDLLSKVDVLSISPTGLQSINPSDFPNIKVVLSGAEACPQSLVDRWGQHTILYSDYGPTECTISAMCTQRLEPGTQVTLGKPFPNTRIYIVDSNLKQVPAGVTGRIFIAGIGMAAGYLNKPELTAQKFLPDLHFPEGYMYDTGDLGRWLENGEISFQGRSDDQVKVKGYRIELDEVSSALSTYPGIIAAATLLKKNGTLVSFVAPDTIDVNAVQVYISKVLPHYMVPSHLISLAKMPMTVNGKTDKRALEDIKTNTVVDAAQNELEKQIAEVWAEVLSITASTIGRHMTFFELGGDSLSAIRACHGLKRIGFELSVAQLFSAQSLAKVADLCEKSETNASVGVNDMDLSEDLKYLDPENAEYEFCTINDQARQEVLQDWPALHLSEGFEAYPASPMQSAMVISTAKNPSAYVNQRTFHLPKDFSLERMRHALAEVLSKRDVLRTSFVILQNAGVVQVLPNVMATVSISKSDASLSEFRMADETQGFNLGEPLWIRMAIVQNEYLVLTIHHALYDGWSLSMIEQDIINCYDGENLVERPSFRNFINHLESQRRALHVDEFWKAYLKGIETPSQALMQNMDTSTASLIDLGVKCRNSFNAIQIASKSAGVTMAVFLKGAWAITLRRFTNLKDIVFGQVISGRDVNLQGVDRILGPTINTVPCRVQINESLMIHEFLQAIQEDYGKMLPYSNIGLVELQNLSGLRADNRIFNTLFVFESLPTSSSATSRSFVTVEEEVWDVKSRSYDFELAIYPTESALYARAKIDDSKIAAASAKRILDEFDATVSRMVELSKASAQATINDVRLSKSEYSKVLSFSGSTDTIKPTYELFHRAFEDQACATPSAVAIEFRGKQLTYQELDAKANGLANILREKGVSHRDNVGLFVSRSIEMVVGLFATLKAGASYVPLDASFPAERLATMVNEAGCSVILFMDEHLRTLCEVTAKVSSPSLALISISHALSCGNELLNTSKPSEISSGQDTCFIAFTSGSTGKPKGVQAHHAGISRLYDEPLKCQKIQHGMRVAQFLAIGFDGAQMEIFMTLSRGAALVLRDDMRLLETIQSVDVLRITPTGLAQFNPDDLPNLKIVFSIGEMLSSSLAEKWASRVELINMYGPTETSVTAVGKVISPEDSVVTVGRPMRGTYAYVLDEQKQVLPCGVLGEVYIGGACVTNGYINSKELNTERFVPNPYTGKGLMYKTGDTGRWLENGELQILGRIDNQVKLRGYRIELEEIENAMCSCAGVTAACAVVKDNVLAAFYTESATVEVANMRASLQLALPHYMVPTKFIVVDEMPLNSNGKTDRNKLKLISIPSAIDDQGISEGVPEELSSAERALAAIWAQILKLEVGSIHRTTSFFEVGGDSLSVIMMTLRANAGAEFMFTSKNVFSTPKLCDLAVFSKNPTPMRALRESTPSRLSLKTRYRILCFHGAGTSSKIFDAQTLGIQNTLPDAEFIFMDGCKETTHADDGVKRFFNGPYFKWWTPNMIGRTLGIGKAVDQVVQQMNSLGPIDGILGFSQGAELVLHLDAMAANGKIPRNWKFSILLSCCHGLNVWAVDGRKNCASPSLHVSGSKAERFLAGRAVTCYDKNKVQMLMHDMGHQIPQSGAFVVQFEEAVRSILREL